MDKLVSVREALESKEWLGTILGGPSFSVMRVLLIAAMGEKLTAEELAIFEQVTQRKKAPTEAADELWIIVARRSGKTLGIAALAAYLAGCCDYRAVLGPGERGMLPILAGSVQQAQTLMNFVKGIFMDAEAAKAEALKGAQALEIANRLKEHAEKLDLALVTIAAASMAYERDVRELNVQLHCTHPNAAQLQSLGVRAVKAGLMLSAFQIEHLAPSERHTFAELTTQWTALIERWAEARLPQSEAAE